MTLTFQNDL